LAESPSIFKTLLVEKLTIEIDFEANLVDLERTYLIISFPEPIP
jgi:hypothetical protein